MFTKIFHVKKAGTNDATPVEVKDENHLQTLCSEHGHQNVVDPETGETMEGWPGPEAVDPGQPSGLSSEELLEQAAKREEEEKAEAARIQEAERLAKEKNDREEAERAEAAQKVVDAKAAEGSGN